MLDRVATHASQPLIAFEVLKQIALGHPERITAEAETQLGFKQGQLHRKEFAADTVREHAFRKIGEIRLPAALHFLRTVTRDDIGPDSSLRISWAAEIALNNALVNEFDDPQGKVQFLEQLLENPRTSSSAVRHWAVNQLCDRGSMISIGVLRKAISHMVPGPDGERQIQFCEARIHVLARHPNRVNAIASVLSTSEADEKLIRWAMHQLAALPSAEADAALTRFSKELASLAAAPENQRTGKYFTLAEDAHFLLRERAEK